VNHDAERRATLGKAHGSTPKLRGACSGLLES